MTFKWGRSRRPQEGEGGAVLGFGWERHPGSRGGGQVRVVLGSYGGDTGISMARARCG